MVAAKSRVAVVVVTVVAVVVAVVIAALVAATVAVVVPAVVPAVVAVTVGTAWRVHHPNGGRPPISRMSLAETRARPSKPSRRQEGRRET
jgi:hypothetical protein